MSASFAETIRVSEAEINSLRHRLHVVEAENAFLRGQPASRLLALEDRLASVGPEERIDVLEAEAAAVGKGTPVAREAYAALQREVALARIHAARDAFHLRSVGTQVYHHHHNNQGEQQQQQQQSFVASQLGEISRLYADEVSQIGEVQEIHARDRRGAEERERQLKVQVEDLTLECSHLKGRLEAHRARANEAEEELTRSDAELRHTRGLLALAEEENVALKATMAAREAKHSEDLRSLHARLERMSSDHGEGVMAIKTRLTVDHESALRRITAERDSLAAQLRQRMAAPPPPSSISVKHHKEEKNEERREEEEEEEEEEERSVPRTESKKKRRAQINQMERLKETVDSQLEIIRKLLAERQQYSLHPQHQKREDGDSESVKIVYSTPPGRGHHHHGHGHGQGHGHGHGNHTRLLGHGDGPCVCFTRGYANHSTPDKEELQGLLEVVASAFKTATGEDLSASILDNGKRVRVASPSLTRREFQVAIVGGHLMAKFHGGWGALGSLIC
jgi:hypothetical protein